MHLYHDANEYDVEVKYEHRRQLHAPLIADEHRHYHRMCHQEHDDEKSRDIVADCAELHQFSLSSVMSVVMNLFLVGTSNVNSSIVSLAHSLNHWQFRSTV